MAIKKRIGLSQKVRFEVFKRDAFTCQYCGSHPPSAILECDHIQPVADGGGNEQDNLVTSCFSCNRGKGATRLTSVPQTLADKAEMVKESEAQLRGYSEIMEAKRSRIEEDVWQVAEVLQAGCSDSEMSRQWLASIKRFNDKLGVHACLEAAHIATDKYPLGTTPTFKYFCGVCWNRVRDL